ESLITTGDFAYGGRNPEAGQPGLTFSITHAVLVEIARDCWRFRPGSGDLSTRGVRCLGDRPLRSGRRAFVREPAPCHLKARTLRQPNPADEPGPCAQGRKEKPARAALEPGGTESDRAAFTPSAPRRVDATHRDTLGRPQLRHHGRRASR